MRGEEILRFELEYRGTLFQVLLGVKSLVFTLTSPQIILDIQEKKVLNISKKERETKIKSPK